METLNSLTKSLAKKPRIGIDCRMWDETGIGRYIRNIVTQISQIDKETDYVLFFLPKNENAQEFPPNFRKVLVDIRWHTLAEQLKLPLVYWKEKLDLLFVPHFNVPILYPGKFVATIHDLTILRVKTGRATTLPYPLYLLKRIAFKMNVLSTVHRAKTIFTVSEFVRRDLVSSFGIENKEVILTPCATSEVFHPIAEDLAAPVLKKYAVNKPYLFYVGNAHPHKNLETLLKAFEIVSKEAPDLTLVLGGKKEFFYERLQNELDGNPLKDKILFIGFIEDEDLPALYSQAEAFVNPSLYEGFGIQILEAFACGTKVICSNTTSLPEIGGDAAFYFDPRNSLNMAQKILKGLKIPHDIKAGFSQAQRFSWERSAREILQKMQKILLPLSTPETKSGSK